MVCHWASHRMKEVKSSSERSLSFCPLNLPVTIAGSGGEKGALRRGFPRGFRSFFRERRVSTTLITSVQIPTFSYSSSDISSARRSYNLVVRGEEWFAIACACSSVPLLFR